MILTASLTTGSVRVARGVDECERVIDEILLTEHLDWESTLNVGDVAFYQSKSRGPFPNHQVRLSSRPSIGFAAIHYTDHDDPMMPVANSWSSAVPTLSVDFIFNGSTGAVFPRSAAVPIDAARQALHEWLGTRRRPTSIEWRPYDIY